MQEQLVRELADGINYLSAHVNLADLVAANDAPTILYQLRNKLRHTGIPFPRFDYAYLVYYAKINAAAQTKAGGWLKNLHLDTVTPAAQSFITETVIAGGLGTISTIVSKADEKVKNWWDKNRHSELEVFHTQEAAQMVKLLPELLAKDLNAYLSKYPKRHPVFFLDTFEDLLGKTRDESYERDHDAWLRNLIIDLPRVLWVICGREPLPWETLHPRQEWQGSIHPCELTELTDAEAHELLAFYKITDTAVQQTIKEASERHPLYLNLSIATYQLIAEDRVPTPADFGSNFQDIYERFIRHLEDIEVGVLKILSCLQGWDKSLFDGLLRELYPAYLTPFIFSQLSRFSFITKNDTGDVYQLHTLMQQHLYEQFSRQAPAEVKDIHRYCFEYLQQQLSTAEEIESQKSLILRAIHHAQRTQPASQVYEWSKEQTEPLDKAVHFDFFLQLLTPLSENMVGEEGDTVSRIHADCLNELGLTNHYRGKYREAEPFHRKALQIRGQVLGEEHLDTASSYNNLAGLLQAQGKYEEAEPFYRKAMKIREQVLGEAHPDTASSYNNLAVLLKAQGKYEEAEPFYRKALATYQQVLGEAHPNTASSYNNLAVLLKAQGKYEEAEPFYRKAIKILEERLGPDHPNTTTGHDNLNSLLAEMGRDTNE